MSDHINRAAYYRKSAGERTGVQSIFKSFQTGFFIAHLTCAITPTCAIDRSDPCVEIELIFLVLRFWRTPLCDNSDMCDTGVLNAHPCAISPTISDMCDTEQSGT